MSLQPIAIEINRLLTKYVEIHDTVFKFSWRKIIPLSFIFKPISFDRLDNQLGGILSELNNHTQDIRDILEIEDGQENPFGNILLKYSMSLIQAISLLEEIVNSLALKSKGSRKYSLTEHNKKCDSYNNAVSEYISIGDKLNELYQKFI